MTVGCSGAGGFDATPDVTLHSMPPARMMQKPAEWECCAAKWRAGRGLIWVIYRPKREHDLKRVPSAAPRNRTRVHELRIPDLFLAVPQSERVGRSRARTP